MGQSATIWVRCDGLDRMSALSQITARLQADGDDANLLITLPKASDMIPAHPRNRREIKAFLDRHQPAVVLYLGGYLDAATVAAIDAQRIPLITLEARPDALREMTGGWFRARPKPMLAGVSAAFAGDAKSAESLRQMGAPAERTFVEGLPDDPVTILPYSEQERQDVARALGTRPVWLAAGLPLSEIDHVITAHRQASRRAHRLLLCVTPQRETDAAALATACREAGLITATRGEEADPEEALQAYIADLPDEDGLWHRVSPISYMGGTLTNGAERDPFEVAALGSVVVHGLHTTPHDERFRHLMRAGASLGLTDATRLGNAIETLLSPDRAAEMATAGWDVTSRGAEVSNRIVTIIQRRLDNLGV